MSAPTTSTALVSTNTSVAVATEVSPGLVPWLDPHTVPREELVTYIQELEQACRAEPRSADLRTCLGMAYAMNYEVDKSMESLETAVSLNPGSFWAQLKYGELNYRLRILNRAEEETLKALPLAANRWQLSIARKQLQDIRALKQTCVRNVEWTKSLGAPALVLSVMLVVIFAAMVWL
jgi:tetratricopeptide (TPR) repeat protein